MSTDFFLYLGFALLALTLSLILNTVWDLLGLHRALKRRFSKHKPTETETKNKTNIT